jgi:N6-adenosine-specific RNA methylase IME4
MKKPHHLTVIKPDKDAAAIGELYRKARGSLIESVRYAHACGERLIAKKATLGHGQWLPWLAANADVLGFESRFTSAKLMRLAENVPLTAHLDEAGALAISHQLWGNEQRRADIYTGEMEWYTPASYVETARLVLGEIDLDPASCEHAQRVVKAQRFYTVDTDGLDKQWHGRVWLNPPYAGELIAAFAKKLLDELERGNVTAAIMLTNGYTDTSWFHALADKSSAFCLTSGRIKFESPYGEKCAPPNGQCFFYFGNRCGAFEEAFRQFGTIVARIADDDGAPKSNPDDDGPDDTDLDSLLRDEHGELTPKARSFIREVRAEKVAKMRCLRDFREAALAGKLRALPDKLYGVLYADPPSRFKTWSDAGKTATSAENHYPTSTLEEIMALDVASIAAPDCALFIWGTVPLDPHVYKVAEAWGFDPNPIEGYKTEWMWVKDRTGTGYWNWNQHETLRLFTRGNIPAPAPGKQWPSVIHAPRGKHSEKPEIFYELIESYFPNLPKIELYARRARKGWDCWGLEAPEAEAAE